MADQLVGAALVAGMVVFLIGAGGWRKAYELPHAESLVAIHRDRGRRAWIHLWILIAMFITPAGLAGFAVGVSGTARSVAAIATMIYTLGAVCWIVSLAFRLAVVPWAAEQIVADGTIPTGFAALDGWAGVLYIVHMASAYAAFVVLGAAVLLDGAFSPWVGWFGLAWGGVLLVGFVATRFAGPFNPPFLAHTYTALLGVLLLR